MSLITEHVGSVDTADQPLASTKTATKIGNPAARWFAAWWVLIPLAVFAAWAFFPSLFTGHDPITGVPADKLQAPSAEHLFGTDHLGRDIYSRVVYGTRQTLLTAGLACLVGSVVGSILGLLAGTAGRFADTVAMRFVDIVLAVPAFLIALILVTATEPGPLSLGLGVGIASIAAFARLVRTEVLRVRSRDFVQAALMSGGKYFTVLRRHIIPHIVGPVLSLLAVDLGAAILAISGLGFLGFGSPPPTPEWGLLISEGRQYLSVAWWLTTLPGLVIVSAVMLTAVLGRAINKAFRF
ncbi:peptide/nickel transport system permease protein [Glutamicibacter mysorens]|uniref:Peptide/nickel transport system permease protein n=1 Tax=Glutamicibacter mysorens TaxID=257984 RepID=A0ABX4N1N9_9MICC|nr:ABC transporter permease [Glutamicibacter mysorens]PJJ45734.1 peptide/nickel transport system permease protein [Glutamicibacter mysorens]